MEFKSNQDLREFVTKLVLDLEQNNEFELANELKMWNNETFTNSSEFLGELMLILERVKLSAKFSRERKQLIIECLIVIKKAFK